MGRIADGRVVEHWSEQGMFPMLLQLGILRRRLRQADGLGGRAGEAQAVGPDVARAGGAIKLMSSVSTSEPTSITFHGKTTCTPRASGSSIGWSVRSTARRSESCSRRRAPGNTRSATFSTSVSATEATIEKASQVGTTGS